MWDLPRSGIEPVSSALARRQGSQVSMRVARGSASWLSSHGRGLGPRDALKKDSRGLSRGAAGNPRVPRLLPGTLGMGSTPSLGGRHMPRGSSARVPRLPCPHAGAELHKGSGHCSAERPLTATRDSLREATKQFLSKTTEAAPGSSLGGTWRAWCLVGTGTMILCNP